MDHDNVDNGLGEYLTIGAPFGQMSYPDHGPYEWKWAHYERYALMNHVHQVTRWWMRDDFSLLEPFVVSVQRDGSAHCVEYLMKERFVETDKPGQRVFAWSFRKTGKGCSMPWEPRPRLYPFEEMEIIGDWKVFPRKIAYESATGLTAEVPFHWVDRSSLGFARVEQDHVFYPAQNKRKLLTPEEDVRMGTYNDLMLSYGYPSSRIQIEVPVTIRRTERPRYADIVVYDDDEHLRPIIVVECKRRDTQLRTEVAQGQRYAIILRALFCVCTNGFHSVTHRMTDRYPSDAIEVKDVPCYDGLSSGLFRLVSTGFFLLWWKVFMSIMKCDGTRAGSTSKQCGWELFIAARH